MAKKLLLVVFFCILNLSSAFAADIKIVRCTFDDEGISASWDSNGESKSENGKLSSKVENTIFSFDQIDLKKGTARFIGNNGAVDVFLVPDTNNLSFLEITPAGNPVLTTVYTDQKSRGERFPAVMSRHMTVLEPLVSQYYGSCVDQTNN